MCVLAPSLWSAKRSGWCGSKALIVPIIFITATVRSRSSPVAEDVARCSSRRWSTGMIRSKSGSPLPSRRPTPPPLAAVLPRVSAADPPLVEAPPAASVDETVCVTQLRASRAGSKNRLNCGKRSGKRVRSPSVRIINAKIISTNGANCGHSFSEAKLKTNVSIRIATAAAAGAITCICSSTLCSTEATYDK